MAANRWKNHRRGPPHIVGTPVALGGLVAVVRGGVFVTGGLALADCTADVGALVLAVALTDAEGGAPMVISGCASLAVALAVALVSEARLVATPVFLASLEAPPPDNK